jgi:hypothetical protein
MKTRVILLCSPFVLAAEQPWKRHTIDDTSKGADGVRLADINGDGLMDITTGWEEGNLVRAYLHPGRGKEKKTWPAVTVGEVASPEDAVFVDLDGDGTMEVISSCEGRTKSIFIHWAPRERSSFLLSNEWTTEVIPATKKSQAWMYALPLDVDAQHGTDLIVGSKGSNGSIGWLENPQTTRDLSKWKFHKIQEAGWIMSLIDTDMNQDGLKDVLVSDRKGTKRGIYWLQHPGKEAVRQDAEWKRHDIGGADREIKFIALGDLDQDGNEDVIAIDKTSIVWFHLQNKKWHEHVIPLPEGVGGGKSPAVFDVNLDGQNDLVFSCEGAKGPLSGMRWLSWRDSPFDKEWQSHEIAGEPGIKYDQVVPYDVDGDGDCDILCCEERDQLGVFWYENPFGGTP